MKFTMQRVRVTGFTVRGVGPIGRVFLPAVDEMTVIYGLNGVGKSSVIDAVVAGLRGVAGGADVHVAVDRPYERADAGSMADNMIRALLQSGASNINSVLDQIGHLHGWNPAEYGLSPEVAAAFRNPGDFFMEENSLGAAVEAMLRWESPDDSDLITMASEVAQQGLFTIRPTGAEDEPRWVLLISAIEDEAAPTTRGFLSRCRSLWTDWSATGAHPEHAAAIVVACISSGLTPEGFREDIVAGVDRPAWAPYPVEDFGVLVPEPGLFPPGLVSEGLHPAEATLAYLLGRDGRSNGLISAMDDDTVVLHSDVEQRLRAVRERANEIMELLVQDPPVLEVEITHPNQWLHGSHAVRWRALDTPSLKYVELQELSAFQRRWASFAIGLAAQGHGFDSNFQDVFLLVDEPERAAHPRSVARLALGLGRIGEEYGAHVIVASHAADFLTPNSAQLMHLRRDVHGCGIGECLEGLSAGGLVEVQDRLGLAPADVLQLIRVVLVVEGQHDSVVLETVLGDELRRRRVHTLAMRGTHNLLTILDSQFLVSFSDAAIVVALDRTNSRKAQRTLEKLKQVDAGATTGTARARQVQEALAPLRKGPPEEQVLAELLHSLLRDGMLDRFGVHGFSKPDIIEYLPVGEFVRDAESWEEAKKSWPRGEPFKKWLRSLGADVSTRRLAAVAANLDEVPKDFAQLLLTCDRAADAPRRRPAATQPGEV